MLDRLKQFFGLGVFGRLYGATRSSQWPRVRAAHLEKQPTCAICGGTKKLNVHHIRPFHLHPELELEPTNLITLCEGAGDGNHHLTFGHFDSYQYKYNPNIIADAAQMLPKMSAKEWPVDNEKTVPSIPLQ